MLGPSNLDLLGRALSDELARRGIGADVWVGPFGQYEQQIIEEGSALYAFGPTDAIVQLELEDLVPDLVRRPFAGDPAERGPRLGRELAKLEGLLDRLQDRLDGTRIFLGSVVSPARAATRSLEYNGPWSIRALAADCNAHLAAIAARRAGRTIVDHDALASWHGQRSWYDDRMWYLGRMRLGHDAMVALAREHATMLVAAHVGPKKCFVVDLDDTLWGGVVGERGLDVTLGSEGLGLAYRDLQEELLSLHDRGILLAVDSKNNPDDALEVIDRHPAMVLRREHFSAIRINWQDKATNLRAIAGELGIGLDSIVFLDDDPVEREWVASQLPEVTVLEMPADPAERRRWLLDLDLFTATGVTSEDLQRAQLYRQRSGVEELRRSSPTLEDFYADLRMRVTIAPAGPATFGRVAQLTQKTNQFNLTTRRCSVGEIEAMASSPDYRVYALSVADRFGDHGLTGVAILAHDGSVARIDTLLLSCRVMGRTIETAFLAFLADASRASGCRALIGEHVPTKQNEPVRELYRSHGFAAVDAEGRRWKLDLASGVPRPPAYIELVLPGMTDRRVA